jgi:hypothetical protein
MIGTTTDPQFVEQFGSSAIERLRGGVDNTLGVADHRILLAPIREIVQGSQAFWRLV